MSRSLRSAPTASSRSLTATTNRSACAPRDGTLPLALHTLEELPAARPTLAGLYRDAPSHVPHESRRSGSRHLCAGHHLASKRVSPSPIPGHAPSPRSEAPSPNNAACTRNPRRQVFLFTPFLLP